MTGPARAALQRVSTSGAPAPTKTHRDENFPVGSWLLRADIRPHVLAFYRFARAADDIADTPTLAAAEKLAKLDALDAAIDEPGRDPLADALGASHGETGCGIAEARRLLDAFRQDAVKDRYESWDALADYCRLSAEPVGRFLLALHGENGTAQAASDGLCTALQVLNHIQDCAKDRAEMDRIYIPEPWLGRVGGEAAFFAPGAEALRRPTLDALLDRVDDALDRAADLPALIADRRLRMEAGVTLTLARRLARRLRMRDPVRQRVALTPADVALALAGAPVWRSTTLSERSDRAIVLTRVRRARTSFAAGMRILPANRRAAVHAIYAFARAVDDVADAPIPPVERLVRLAAWRDAVARIADGAPVGPLERELVRATKRFALPLIELERLIDGMAQDCVDQVRLTTPLALGLYCRRAAGTVGLLSAHAFGLFDEPSSRRTADRFARTLGEALQLINILRDVREDAGEGRLYVPLGQTIGSVETALRDPRLPKVCDAMALHARKRIAGARAMSHDLDPAALRPALLMLHTYEGVLDRVEARAKSEGWPLPTRTRLSRSAKLRLALDAFRPSRRP